MPNTITSTGIVNASYNSRALITHGFDTRALARQSDGTLWAAINLGHLGIRIYRSQDNGFSWETVWSSGYIRESWYSAENTHGAFISLHLFEDINRLVVLHQIVDDDDLLRLEVFRWKLDTMELIEWQEPIDGEPAEYQEVPENPMDYNSVGSFLAPYNQNMIYVSSTGESGFFVLDLRAATQESIYGISVLAGTYAPTFSGVAHENGYVDYLLSSVSATGSNQLVHTRYTEAAPASSAFSTPIVIKTLGLGTARDLSIARDGWGTLLALWSEVNAAGTDAVPTYAISRDRGTTWTSAVALPRSAGHSVYTDIITGQITARTTTLGGLQGFLIGYVDRDAESVPKTYVREVETVDGQTYILGDERQIATEIAFDNEPVVGLRWFHPPGGSLMDLSDPGHVRVAYQIGEGDAAFGWDTRPVRLGQELLEAAFAEEEIVGEYVTDLPTDNDLLVTLNILGGPSENVDYYSLGLTGYVTKRYIAAFEKVSTEARFFRYEPLPHAEMNDRSAYYSPSEYIVPIVIDPQTYDFPLADRGNESYQSYIERDVRRIYLPPTFHLERTFLVNQGNFLKRTVWTFYFDGNDYEVSQVVPYFLDGQIAYYSANAYVIGPSNNPFSRRILPSET